MRPPCAGRRRGAGCCGRGRGWAANVAIAGRTGRPCLPVSQPLLKIPDWCAIDQTKVLRGTMLLTDEQRG